jgi:two-component system sensor histidine kinase YesM
MKINFTIKIKLVIIFFILTTVPIIVVGTFSYYQAKNTISKLTIESAMKTTEQLSSDVRSIFSETEIFLEIGNHKSIRQVLFDKKNNYDYENIQEIFKAYRNAYKHNENILDIYIIGKNRRVISEKKGIYSLEQAQFEANPIYNEITKESKKIMVLPNYTSEYLLYKNIGNIISFGTTINDTETGEILGIIAVDFDTSIFEKICNKATVGESGKFYILDKSNMLIFNPSKQYVDHVSDYKWYEIFNKKKGSTIQILSGVKYLIVSDIPENLAFGWRIFGEVPVSEIMREAYNIKNLTMNMIEICLLLSLILFTFLTDIITRPIITLKNQMLSAEKGDLEAKVDFKGTNEFSDLGKSFNEMIKKIRILIDNNNKEHEKLKKAELNIMQAQINPHFLYNSLDAIIWMAEGGDKEKIIDIVSALSGFFRISLSKGADIINLEREIEHCKNYLIIQKMRYGELLSYSFNIDKRILSEKIIKITLQPIVENAIYHGIKNKKNGGSVKISAFMKNEDEIEIVVEDNGIGIKENKLLEIRKTLLKSDSTEDNENNINIQKGFGINNVNERIKLYFGEEYGLNIDSTWQEGTKVSIKIPMVR